MDERIKELNDKVAKEQGLVSEASNKLGITRNQILNLEKEVLIRQGRVSAWREDLDKIKSKTKVKKKKEKEEDEEEE